MTVWHAARELPKTSGEHAIMARGLSLSLTVCRGKGYWPSDASPRAIMACSPAVLAGGPRAILSKWLPGLPFWQFRGSPSASLAGKACHSGGLLPFWRVGLVWHAFLAGMPAVLAYQQMAFLPFWQSGMPFWLACLLLGLPVCHAGLSSWQNGNLTLT